MLVLIVIGVLLVMAGYAIFSYFLPGNLTANVVKPRWVPWRVLKQHRRCYA
jgi:hypothetical protein